MNDNPYQSPQAEREAPIEVRFGDVLPPVCVVCGATATTTATKLVQLPNDPSDKGMWIAQILLLLSGFIFYWSSNRVKLDRKLLRLPCCARHTHDVSSVALRAVDQSVVQVAAVSPEFRQAIAALQTPPSPALLAAMDQGRGDGDFLKAIEKTNVSSPNEFFKGLEERGLR